MKRVWAVVPINDILSCASTPTRLSPENSAIWTIIHPNLLFSLSPLPFLGLSLSLQIMRVKGRVWVKNGSRISYYFVRTCAWYSNKTTQHNTTKKKKKDQLDRRQVTWVSLKGLDPFFFAHCWPTATTTAKKLISCGLALGCFLSAEERGRRLGEWHGRKWKNNPEKSNSSNLGFFFLAVSQR